MNKSPQEMLRKVVHDTSTTQHTWNITHTLEQDTPWELGIQVRGQSAATLCFCYTYTGPHIHATFTQPCTVLYSYTICWSIQLCWYGRLPNQWMCISWKWKLVSCFKLSTQALWSWSICCCFLRTVYVLMCTCACIWMKVWLHSLYWSKLHLQFVYA